ncbi:pyridoxamine 5'-phosphate oxidase family protein [Mucilaginibacter gotjawali]|uniref:General stress protein 26 n=2 Tax=Mucilaginibacter gotjawali TaxID=1550579 RepID=A0A839SHU2_9SPHI|nr:pyridoxamine 5'-phosphate oxidase family protein [Mucilaginibacter gotjawali]MBB3057416.1 general stress protein 26 [Mucilaginibacter gotjawali]BAU55466.1 Pyridoxamine 5'-phosphate oxidase [Mucilaginibacter gotjawali]
MTKEFLYNFIKQHRLAVISTTSKKNKPEAALIGFAVSEELEIVFDTVKTSRKYQNLLHNPNVAIVIGWDNETTVQYEGIATELSGDDAGRYKEIYFSVYPDGRERAVTWPHIVHFKVIPKWIRYSNFNEPVVVEELTGPF